MNETALRLQDIFRCFQGVIPSIVATSDARGIPNVTYVSQIYLVDDTHVALSCQFFNKTRRNLSENPYVAAEVMDPVTMQAYRLQLRFLRSETSGPLFETMAMRIDAIASQTGMTGVFKLIASDVFEVLHAEEVAGFLSEPPVIDDPPFRLDGSRTELRGLQWMSESINRATDLEKLLDAVLDALDSYFNFHHTMVLLHDDAAGKLVTIASRGYGESGVGAEIAVGQGLIGTAARERRVLRVTSLDADLRYGRSIRREMLSDQPQGQLRPEIALPGLPDAQSLLAIPLAIGARLVGILVAESRNVMRFGEWHEAYSSRSSAIRSPSASTA